ncbi:TetR family transcriptional regulator [Escherichia coli]|nr:TetR family transcriptional regulator [Escherichia coli]
MVTKKQSRVPGRPRRFAPEQAVSAAKVLFHQKGFDAVSVAEVTDYLGINPPSLYAAFGSKAGLFSRVLNEYVGTEAIPAETTIYDYIARRHPQSAQCVTDFMSTVMSGLSAKAREGHSIEQLCATAALAGEAIKTLLKE